MGKIQGAKKRFYLQLNCHILLRENCHTRVSLTNVSPLMLSKFDSRTLVI